MQSSGVFIRKWQWRIAGGMLAAAALIWAREWVALAATQLFLGMVAAYAVLPVMKWLEKRCAPGVAASLALLLPGLAAGAGLTLLLPPLVAQGRAWFAMLPSLLGTMGQWVQRAQSWLGRSGLPVDAELQEMVLERAQQAISAAAPTLMERLGKLAGSMGRWMLAPVFAFYFLRDRRSISHWLLSLVPVNRRSLTVRTLREMRREVAGYLRGQLLISAAVGALSAVGLLLCGVPSWLFLGLLIGVLEWIPYAGPVIGGVLAALFALPMGWGRALWAAGVVAAVQQMDGTFLSPKLLSDATRLHPLIVILCITVGGAAAGMAGILLSVPLLLCLRAVLRTALQSPLIQEPDEM